MDNLFLVRDFFNQTSGIVDHNNIPSSPGHRICGALNQPSGYINFKGGSGNFYAIPSESSLVPESVYVKATFISGYPNDFSFSANMNGVNLLTTTFPQSGTYTLSDGEYRISKSGYFTPSSGQLATLIHNRGYYGPYPKNNFINLNVISSSGFLITDDCKLSNIEIGFDGRSYKSSTNLTSIVESFYCNNITSSYYNSDTGVYANNPDNIKGPTNSSGNDNHWIYRDFDYDSLYRYDDDGNTYNFHSFEFRFNTSGFVYEDNRSIEKLIFSARIENQSGNQTNVRDWCNLSLYNNIGKAIGYGSGFLVGNQSGFGIFESELSFIDDNGLPSNQYKVPSSIDEFYVTLHQMPVGAKLSSIQTDIYLSNDSTFSMIVKGNVNSGSGVLNPKMSSSYNPGYNRLKRSSYESGIFSNYKPLYSGDSITIKYTPEVWSNYYNEKIDTTDGNRHQYNNYLYLKENNYITETMNTTDKFAFMFLCSTSGNTLPSGDEGYGNPYYDDCIEAGNFAYEYLRSRFGATLLEKKTGTNTDFRLYIEDEKIKINVKDGIYTQTGEFNSEPNSLILITGQRSGFLNTVDIYSFDQNGAFAKVFSKNVSLGGGLGNIYIGGSGINDFNGYLHEYGIGSKYLEYQDILDFQYSRYNISKVLENNPLELDARRTNKKIKDNFTINFDGMAGTSGLYQNIISSFSYDTIINKDSYLIEIDYESNNNINISGVYSEDYRLGSSIGPDVFNIINFKTKTLLSGIHSVILEPYTFANELIRPNIDYHMYSKFDFEINSIDSDRLIDDNTLYYLLDDNNLSYLTSDNSESGSNDIDFKINDIRMLFKGSYIQTAAYNNFDLLVYGKTTSSSGLDLYLGNQIENSSLDFFTGGYSNYSGSLNFHTIGSFTQQSGIDFVTSSSLIGYNGLDFYTKGPIIYDITRNEGVIEMFLGADTEISFKTLNMFTKSIPYVSGYPSGYYPPDGYSFIYDSINFFTGYTEEKTKESINFFTKSDTITDKHLNMYLSNNQSHTKYQLDFYLPSTYNQSGNINMFIKGI